MKPEVALIAHVLGCLLLAFTLSVSTAFAEPPPKTTIYVGPHVREGFVDVDSGVLDSIHDIQDELRRSPLFVVVATADKASIVLVVVGRRLSGNGGAVGITTPGTSFGGGSVAGVQQPTYTTPGVTTMIPIDRHAIDTILRVGAYEKAISSEEPNGAGWKYVARVVVKDVSAWLEANRSALVQRELPGATPAEGDCELVAGDISRATGATLAEKIRSLHPGAYGSMSDAKLESLFRTSFPCLPK